MTDRKDAPTALRWDLTAIYENPAAFRADFELAKRLIAAFPAHRETMTEDAGGLYAALRDNAEITRLLSKLGEYASLSSDLDKGNNEALSLLQRVTDLENEAVAASYFLEPALIKLKDGSLCRFFAEYAPLDEYRRQITVIRRYRPYMLGDEGEQLLAKIQPVLHSHGEIHSIFANADLTFGAITGEDGGRIKITSANYVPLLMSPKRAVRRAAFHTLYATYRAFGNTLASLLFARIREKVTLSGLRRFESSLQASTFADEVTPAIYHTLIDTVGKNLAPLFAYYRLKREVLGVSHLHMYDVYAPLMPAYNAKYTYDQAISLVLNTVQVLGKEYQSVLAAGLGEGRWVDVYPGKGKRSGAYSAGCYDTEPYILLNFMGRLDDVSTLAHEAGHSMHTYFSNSANTPQDARYTIFVAEVASTVNELLLTRKLLRETTVREEKLALLNQLMETYKGTLYRQTMFAEFELEMHTLCAEGEPLTQELLCNRYYEIVRRYFGRDVVCDKDIAYEWMRIPHFYSCFYVYKYATCICAASGIVKRIETQGQAYVEQYLAFLRCGGSHSPADSLKLAGIDLTRPEVITDAIADFSAAVSEFEKLYREE